MSDGDEPLSWMEDGMLLFSRACDKLCREEMVEGLRRLDDCLTIDASGN
jgi:hypothetical protein